MQREQISLLFSYVYFSKFSLIPFVGIHIWQKGWKKIEVRTELGNHIQTTKRDPIHSRRLALLILQFELCMRTVAIATCLSFRYLTVVPSFKYQKWDFLHIIHHFISFILHISFQIPFQNQKFLKLYFLLSKKKHFKWLNPLFLLKNFLMKMFLSVKREPGRTSKKKNVENMMLKKKEVDILKAQRFMNRRVSNLEIKNK